jgi:hypothetical protein
LPEKLLEIKELEDIPKTKNKDQDEFLNIINMETFDILSRFL